MQYLYFFVLIMSTFYYHLSFRSNQYTRYHHGNFRKRIFGNFHQANHHIIYDLFHHFR